MIAQDFEVDQDHSLVVVRFHTPELTGPVMQEAAVEMEQRLRYHNASYFVLDVAAVEFMDSACVGAMVQFLQEVEHVRGRIALAGCRPNTAFLFRVTRLDSVFGLYDDVADARAGVVSA